MTPAVLLREIEDSLRPLVQGEGGELDVGETPEDTLSLLGVSPSNFRVILQWAGHDGDGATYGSSRVGRIAVIVQAAKGMRVDRGADLHRPAPADPTKLPFLELVAKVNAFIRSLVFLDSEGQLVDDIEHIKSRNRRQCFTELGGDWLEIEGVALRQYQTNFSLRYADTAA